MNAELAMAKEIAAQAGQLLVQIRAEAGEIAPDDKAALKALRDKADREANDLITAQLVLADGDALLSAGEREVIAAQMTELQALLDGADAEVIRQQTERLGRHSEAFATRRMDRSIREALAGVSLDALDDEVTQ